MIGGIGASLDSASGGDTATQASVVQDPALMLALDPGQRKLGWALVDLQGHAVGLGIWPESSWEAELQRRIDSGALAGLATIVLGDGTHRVNIEAGLRRLLPEAAIAVVDERGSTVEAWQLKRQEVAGDSWLRQLQFTIGQLFNSGPVDDFAAWVLALRYLKSKQ
jgi:RNase H-fold protein (predicted Holliday junction resolvase)